MDLSLLRDNVIIERYQELVKKYSEDTIEMEKFLANFQQVRIELLLLEEEMKLRGLSK